MSRFWNKPGFTLMELVLSIAMLGVLIGITVPVYLSFRQREDANLSAIATAQSWRRAAQLSRSGEQDGEWGVYVQNGSVTMFSGSSYSARDTSYDEVTLISPAVSISGSPTETVFSVLEGLPNATGTITFTGADNSSAYSTINAQGMVAN